eukprot:12884984-Prorocentrum_lima.AAC.1
MSEVPCTTEQRGRHKAEELAIGKKDAPRNTHGRSSRAIMIAEKTQHPLNGLTPPLAHFLDK